MRVMPISASAARWTVRGSLAAAVLLMLLTFVGLASVGLGWLGPYYDEWIFVPVSLRFLGECELDAAVGIAKGCLPLMQSPPYVGVIKAALMAPVFGLFGVDAWSVRLPPILLTAFVLWRFQRFLSPRIGALALAGLMLMAIDPVLIEHVRLDWGPFVVSNLCKLLGLAALWRWLESGRSGDLLLALALCLIGLVDKLSFVWVVVAYALAVVIALPDWLLARLRTMPRGQWITLGVAGLLMLWVALRLILPAMQIKLPGFEQPLGLWERLLRVLDLHDLTFSGLALRRWVFGVDIAAPLWPRLLLGLQCLLALVTLALRYRYYADDRGPLRLLAFSSVALMGLLGMLVATREVGGSHHLVVLWPFPLLQALALAAVWWRWASGRAGRVLAIAAALPLLLLPAMHGALTYRDALPFWRGEVQVRGHFDPLLYRVAERLQSLQPEAVISTRWGLHHGLISLAPEAQRARYRDWTWILVAPPEQDVARTDWLQRTFLEGRRVAWVSYLRLDADIPASHAEDYLQRWKACEIDRERIDGRSEQVAVEIRLLQLGADECRSTPAALHDASAAAASADLNPEPAAAD